MKNRILSILFIAIMLFSVVMTVEAATCNHSWNVTAFVSEEHTQTCGTCGEMQVAGHNWVLKDQGDVNNHTLKCSVCGQVKTQMHTYVDGGKFLWINFAKCSVCEAKYGTSDTGVYDGSANPSTCTHTWGVKSTNAGNHTLACRHCGIEKSEIHTNEGISIADGSTFSYEGVPTTVTHVYGNDSCTWNEMYTAEERAITHPAIEEYYNSNGTHATSTTDEFTVNNTAFKIWYPTDLEQGEDTYPVICFCNGTGSSYQDGKTDYEGYRNLFTYMASWGYIVVANSNDNDGNGASASMALDVLLDKNEDTNSIFYGKVDVDKIALAGHSQGGAGVFNAATRYENSEMFGAIYAASAMHPQLATSGIQIDLGIFGVVGIPACPYDATKITAPIFMDAGTGATGIMSDATVICPLEDGLNTNLASVPGTAVVARRKWAEHGDMISVGKGYMMAWFQYNLLGDSYAAGAFTGENAELFNNPFWQDQNSKNLGTIQ